MKNATLVYICAPYRAPTENEIKENIRFANVAASLIAAWDNNVIPVVPHNLFPSDIFKSQKTEKWFLDATLEIMRRCDVVAVATLYNVISAGMQGEIKEAKKLKMKIINI
jgi:nucleoside 2-deoxyribosyltransferase